MAVIRLGSIKVSIAIPTAGRAAVLQRLLRRTILHSRVPTASLVLPRWPEWWVWWPVALTSLAHHGRDSLPPAGVPLVFRRHVEIPVSTVLLRLGSPCIRVDCIQLADSRFRRVMDSSKLVAASSVLLASSSKRLVSGSHRVGFSMRMARNSISEDLSNSLETTSSSPVS
mmetsp:Transcript_9049/g.21609  ORF Transcript_9049/g.21609 Transcript_9049/m.21609 type:complete len:170 (+) Transcript_9049:853-1362(+)